MSIAFIFPGQGSQIVGMGKQTAEDFPEAKEIFQRADEAVGWKVSQYCFEGPQDELNKTSISQPAIFAASVAMLEVIKNRTALKPDVTAGLSLGEYTALYAAGMLSFEDAAVLVQQRGEAMQKAAENSSGSMLSVLKLDEDKVMEVVEKARQGDTLVAANFNCPGQIVLSGSPEACSRAAELASEMGALKTVELAVAGAFHSPLMQPAADALREALNSKEIVLGKAKVISNASAEYYSSAEHVRDGLCLQLTSSVLWQRCMERLIEDGTDDFYEIGPGRVLTGLMKKIDRKQKVTNLSNAGSIKKFIESLED
ncbi:ACP S-malonyltransferase [Sedimentisphaera salicampi]|uniref:Malonyl CoA-acyl carrier protein transacylase n=1 Tax=Sedimentisphaera salicampi TaxID=1941349 RepID=A0A1W6LKW2_9BACT|nr:ACP S-malonyltransferase [Sedimentisphaera salicampi]ARN56383.1 Malonyl CoA-acyl carrier protein transacylase [Sedimentisphaera salicampi]